jgi:uncharacterized protein
VSAVQAGSLPVRRMATPSNGPPPLQPAPRESANETGHCRGPGHDGDLVGKDPGLGEGLVYWSGPRHPGRAFLLNFTGPPHAHSTGVLAMVLTFLAVGLVAGVLSGLFGIGGGILIIPALIFLAKFPTKLALGTSLGAMLLPVGLLGAYAYYQQGHLNIKASMLIGLGLFLGAYAGARLAQHLSGATLQRMFAVFIVIMAVRLWIEAGKG